MILSRFAGDLPVHLGDAGCEPKQVAPAPPTPSRPGSGPPMRQARYRPRPQPAARRRERTTPPPARPRTRGPAVGSDPISGPRDPGCRPRRSRGSPTPYRAWQSRPPAKRSAPWCSMTGSRGRPGATGSCRTSQPTSGSAPTREAPPADLAGPRNRGVRDILIACVDGLASFAIAVTAAFPAAVVRPCAAPHPQPATARTANATTSPPEGQLKTPDETSPTLARLQQAR
jgi:hypothetical protein